MLVLVRRRDLAASFAPFIGLVAAAAICALAAVFALDRYASSATWVTAVDEVVFVAIGLAVLAKGGRRAREGAVIGLGLLAHFTGATKAAALLHGVVLSALPADATRVLVVIALTSGAAAVASGAMLSLSWRAPVGKRATN